MHSRMMYSTFHSISLHSSELLCVIMQTVLDGEEEFFFSGFGRYHHEDESSATGTTSKSSSAVGATVEAHS